jgi:HAD superfamily hydrolase (TIGR01509 family)
MIENESRKTLGLLFDMGDVLYDATIWRRWLLQLLHRMGLHTQYRPFFKIWDCDFLDDVHCGRREYGEAFQAFLLSAGLTRGQIDEVEAASQARKRELEGGVRPFPGVRSVLDRLHKSEVAMGVLSDSESTAEELQARLNRLGIGQYLIAVVSSIDLERTKPDPVCYRAAAAAMGLAAEEIAFVGHDAEELAGAKAVGMSAWAFNFDDDVPSAGAADRHLKRFDELLQCIDRRERVAPAKSGAF